MKLQRIAIITHPLFIVGLILSMMTGCEPFESREQSEEAPIAIKDKEAIEATTDKEVIRVEDEGEAETGAELDRHGIPDFAEEFETLEPLQIGDKPNRTLSGVFPDGLTIRSFWSGAEFRGTIEALGQDSYAGDNAIRLDLEHTKSCYVDLYTKQTFSSDQYLKIQVGLRAPRTGRFDLLICKADSPGKDIWERKRIYIPAEWQEQEFILRPQSNLPANTPLIVLLRFSEADIYDIDALRIWELTGDELNAGIPERRGNLLSNSRFPAGLPNGWSVNRAGYPNLVQTDPEIRGPSGQAALQFMANRRLELRSRPFSAHGGKPHTLRFQAKGSQAGQNIQIRLDSGAEREKASFTLSKEWQSYEVEMNMPYPLNGFQFLVVRASAPIALDQIELIASTQPETPEKAASIEITSKADNYYALTVGEKPYSVTVSLVGAADDQGTLAGQLVDTFGKAVELEPTPFHLGSEGFQAIQLKLPSDLHSSVYGTHRLELRARDESGELSSDWNELLLHRIRPAPMLGRDAPNSPFGLHLSGASERQLETAKQLGFNWVRLHDGASFTKWYNLEKDADKGLVFDAAREKVQRIRAHDLMILGLLDTSPPWHSNNPKKTNTRYFWDATWMPTDIETWQAYAEATSRAFRNEITHWEIWNEPYVGLFFQKAPKQPRGSVKGSPADYAPLAEAAYAGAKRGNSNAQIFIATKAGTWADAAKELGTVHHADGSTFHLYTPKLSGFPGDMVASSAASIRQSFEGTPLADKPIWQTEGGPGSILPHAYRHTPPTKHQNGLELADYVVRFYTAHLAAGVDKYFLYTLHSIGSWTPSWGLIGDDDSLQPWASALSNLACHIENRRWAGRTQLEGGSDLHLFSSEDLGGIAVILPPLNGAIQLPALAEGMQAYDLFGNPLDLESSAIAYPVYIHLTGAQPDATWKKIIGAVKE